jgi:hypothetical protein
MRRINRRVVMVGAVLIGLAAAFFFAMGAMAPKSNDPAAMLRTVGEVSGVLAGVGLVMIVLGLVGKKSIGTRN